MTRDCTLIVIAKEPVPGRVKTRLTPPFTACQAADLARAALADTLAAVQAAVPVARSRGIAVHPVLALDGRSGQWLDALLESGPAIPVIAQRAGGLDVRLAAAFADATADRTHRQALLVGMDTPQIAARMLVDAVDELNAPGIDAVLGAANDGGWWALGLHRPDSGLLHGVPMSTPHTGADQLDRLTSAGLHVAMLPTLTDVDTEADARAVAAQAPRTQFAATLRRLGRVRS